MRTRRTLSTTERLTRRGLRLEYATLGWNVIGVPILVVAAIRSGSAAAAGFAFDSAIEIGASSVVVWELTEAHPVVELRLFARRPCSG